MQKEIWKDISWYEWFYKVSNIWRIKSLERYKANWVKKQLVPERILKFWDNGNWYKIVWLHKNWINKIYYVHRLVAISFLWLKIWLDVNHIDWDKANNKLENIEWCTRSHNLKHKYKVLWYKPYNYWWYLEKSKSAKKVNQYDLFWNFIKTWCCMKLAANELWICLSWISNVVNGIRKTHWWYIWEFVKKENLK